MSETPLDILMYRLSRIQKAIIKQQLDDAAEEVRQFFDAQRAALREESRQQLFDAERLRIEQKKR